ncbi:ABC transporter permease subunit [Gemmata sp. G18]|uniref:ABC transporter permease subunit n=1 Tax=Gemmata palustris TaxID=2822762 RepID=A0ABS5C464_9BACT|nr:ABC transporter permease subunit [Gemmata palustris]MBP3960789.1 ABC transporter permease subunit [Gemmata palustris]
MSNEPLTAHAPVPAPHDPLPSAFRAWGVLVVQSFQRHWRVRQMGWVSVALLGIVVLWVSVVTVRGGWDLANQRARRSANTNAEEAERLTPGQRYRALDADEMLLFRMHEVPNPLNPTEDALASLLLSIPQAAMRSEAFLKSWAFMTYSRWVVMLVFMGFILPLFTLSYASGAFGTDRESRSLVWLMTRPIPRSGIYLAKFLGTLPWCVAFGAGGFVAVCLAAGSIGHEALLRYWPAVAMGTVAFSALFHLVGALFRRPVVVGLVYVFFFETVVAALPGSLKLLSLTFYVRSLMYNEAVAAGHPGDMLPAITAQAVSSETAWAVLTAAPVAITLVGMWLFSRSEYRDDI